MTTKTEAILAYVATLLAGTAAIAAGNIYRSRPEPVSRDESPALLIEKIGETADYSNLAYLDWTLQFRIAIVTRGAVPDTLADPILTSAYSLLMADRTLGGRVFDILPHSINFRVLEGDQPVGITDCIFTVKHRTDAADLTTYTS